MGAIFSRISLLPRRKKSSKETLEALESELQSLSKSREGSRQCESAIMSVLLIVLLLTYPLITTVGVVSWVWFRDALSNEYFVIYLLILISFPILLYGFKRMTNAWFARRKTQYASAIQSVLEEKQRILNDVMETEPYKVARELLEKYDPKNPQLLPREPQAHQTVRHRRPVVPQSPHPALLHQTPARTPQVTQNTPRPPHPPQQQTPLPLSRGGNTAGDNRDTTTAAAAVIGATPHVTTTGRQQPQTPNNNQGELGGQYVAPGYSVGVGPGPPTPVPILPRDRTSFDRVMDFVLGDGPSNRYALVCSQCYSHNGMALKDEFEYLSFRCAYCYHFNQARKSRPAQQQSLSQLSSTNSSSAAVASASSVSSVEESTAAGSDDEKELAPSTTQEAVET